MRFTDNSALTAANATTSDILVGTDVSSGNDMKMTLGNLGEYMVEDYAGSTIAGSAQSVQSAINTLNSNLTSLSNTFVIENAFTGDITIAGGGRASNTIDVTKSGYNLVGIIGIYVASTDVFAVNEFYAYSTTHAGLVMSNLYNDSRTSNVRLTLLYKKQ